MPDTLLLALAINVAILVVGMALLANFTHWEP